jgi:hypothetical protein
MSDRRLAKYKFTDSNGVSIEQFTFAEICLRVHDFKDQLGHHLIACVDFQDILKERGVKLESYGILDSEIIGGEND